MLLNLAIGSVVLTVLILVIGLYIIFTGGRKSNQPKKKERDDVESPQEENLGLWYRFGFVDDTPNIVRQVVSGSKNTGRPYRYFGNIDDGIVNPNNGVIDTKPGDYKVEDMEDEGFLLNFIRRHFGKRWYGIPFIYNLKPLTIDRVVFTETKTKEELSSSVVVRHGLYREILRPTRHEDVDASNNITFSVTSLAKLIVTDARPAFNVYTDNFLIIISNIIRNFFSRNTIQMTYADYKKVGNCFDDEQIGQLNDLLKPLGVKVTQLTFGDPKLDPKIQKQMEAEAIAEQEAKAKIKKGQGEKQYTIDTKEGEAQGIERIASANRRRFQELTEYYKSQGFTGREAVQEANAMVSAEFNAQAIGKLTGTFVNGGGNTGVQLAITDRRSNARSEEVPETPLVVATDAHQPPPRQEAPRPKGDRDTRKQGGKK